MRLAACYASASSGTLRRIPFTILGWRVSDISGTMAELAAIGAVFESYGFPGQEASGIWLAPDGTQVAWFKDPDGNLLSLTQFK